MASCIRRGRPGTSTSGANATPTTVIGEVGAQQLSNGQIYAVYDQGFVKRYVFATMSAYRPGQLWVYTWSDFTDPSRADYGVHNWFLRE
jgi:hypothetical protein